MLVKNSSYGSFAGSFTLEFGMDANDSASWLSYNGGYMVIVVNRSFHQPHSTYTAIHVFNYPTQCMYKCLLFIYRFT